jgi:SAM-dependent methyltransferase
MEQKDNEGLLPEFLLKKDENSFRNFLGARKETIIRLQDLYKRDYFEDEKSTNNEERVIVEKRREMYKQEFFRINKYFDIKNGGNVLDIGCGEGGFLSLFGSNWKKYGVDISGYALEVARKSGVIVDFDFEDKLFDLIIFRGTIQHIPDPISRIEKCYYWLKDKGGLVFLVTPNTNSLYYKLFNTLPLLSDARNFFVPSDIVLKHILINFGYKVKGIEYPYLGTPYALPFKDLFKFILKVLRIKKNMKVSFYKNIMEVYAEKP